MKVGTDFVFRCRCSLTRFAQNALWEYRLAALVFLAGKLGCLDTWLLLISSPLTFAWQMLRTNWGFYEVLQFVLRLCLALRVPW